MHWRFSILPIAEKGLIMKAVPKGRLCRAKVFFAPRESMLCAEGRGRLLRGNVKTTSMDDKTTSMDDKTTSMDDKTSSILDTFMLNDK